jgi:flagellar hook-associated protein 1 FlgK
MSTFSGLSTAYSGLVAARAGMDVVGQNIANANTDGYTRQRVLTSSVAAPAQTGLFTSGVRPGQGVSVDAIARLGNLQLDAQVRSSAAASGYQSTRADVLATVEASLQEPGENGISGQLQEMWASWQDLSNRAGEPAAAALVLSNASVVATSLADKYQQVDNAWTNQRSAVDTMGSQLNSAAGQVADLNVQIRATLASGGNANELVDKRATLTETIASLAGGTVREKADGTVDVFIGGNALVSGDTARSVTVVGSRSLDGAAGSPVALEWAHRPGSPVALDGGKIAGALSVLAPATAAGTGGTLAEVAASYDGFATQLAAQVNALHSAGTTPSGATGSDFFGFTAGVPAAKGLTVLPTDAGGLATGTPGAGAFDGSVADAISQLGVGPGSPDSRWTAFVTTTAVAAQTEAHHAVLTDVAATSTKNQQLSNSTVDMDEENVNLLTFQHAYQGAARVLTAVDEMLDVLINRTGLVGR